MLGALFADDLAKARRAAERGRGKAAVRHAWSAGLQAHARADQEILAEVVALLDGIATAPGAAPAVAADAEKGRAYCAACLADLRAGKRPPSLLGKLLGGGGAGGGSLGGLRAPARERRVEKTCPDCAERVLAEARVCRFCGHRFDDEAGGPA